MFTGDVDTQLPDSFSRFPYRLGRVVVPFTLDVSACGASMDVLRASARRAAPLVIQPHDERLKAHHITSQPCSMSVSKYISEGVCGRILLDDGSPCGYFTCSSNWRLTVGALESFSDVPRFLRVIMCCLGEFFRWRLPNSAKLDDPGLALPPPLYDDPFGCHVWPGTNVFSTLAIDRPVGLCQSFRGAPIDDVLQAEGWFGSRCGSLPAGAWCAAYKTVEALEDAAFLRWHSSICECINTELDNCCGQFNDKPELPSGKSTTHVPFIGLRLKMLLTNINNSTLPLSAEWEHGESRGCHITFHFWNDRKLIVTANGSFDSRPFPATSQLQAEMLTNVISAFAPPASFCAPAEIAPQERPAHL